MVDVDLPLQQSIDYQAGLAFANLAPREVPRSRRRAGSRRRISPTVINTAPLRVPLGTPKRLAPKEQFSHIQIIPRPESIVNDENSLPQPMFRSNPLSQEVDLQVKVPEPKKLFTSTSTDSLANNFSGTTFAAKARAAELNAARARFNAGNESSKPGTSSEPLKLVKHRPRPNRVWKPLDLKEIPEDVPDVDVDGGYSVQSSPGKTGAGNEDAPKDYSYFDGKVVKRVYAADCVVDTLKPQNFPRLSRPNSADPELSPESKKLAENVSNYDASEWDPDLTAKEVAGSRPLSRVASSHGSSEAYSIAVRSEARSSIPRENRNSVYLDLDQDTPIMTVPRYPISILPRFLDAPKTPSPQPGTCSPTSPAMFTVDPNNDPFSENITNVTQSRYPRNEYDKYAPKYIIPKNAPHHYPAVKGTMDYQYQFPHPPILGHHAYGRYPQHSPIPDVRPGFWTDTNAHDLETPYRRLSANDKKNLLAQQLADFESQQAGSSKSTRTVLHDPIATANAKAHLTTPVQAPGSPQPENELAKMSDPLPWRTRPVDVVTTPGLSTAEYIPKQANSVGKRQMTIAEARDTLAAQSLADAESWWRHDNRIGPNASADIDAFVDARKRENSSANKTHAREAAFVLAQRRKEFPDNWSEKSYATEVPEIPNAADVCDDLLVPVLKNFSVYLDTNQEKGYFGRFGRVNEWAIDSSHAGQQSFFEKDWGQPPARVGRDPRYRHTLHNAMYPFYEDFGPRGNDVYGRRFR
ncbi:MAG: hypothetical protein MMC33_009982 [Icmadophila ericetorum]|nr:hypothetical protein [Icmadophila ericetorum]